MSDIPANILAAQAAGNIPDGVSLEYLAQSGDGGSKIAVLVLGCLALVVVLSRCYARIWLIKKMGRDDALAILTMVLDIAFVVLCVILIDDGASRHEEYIQYILPNSTVNQIEILDSTAHIIYTTCLFACRLSGLAFYSRLAFPYSKLHLGIRIATVFLILVYIPQICLIIFHCHPVTFLWPYDYQVPEMSEYTCITWGTPYLVNSALSLVCDLVVFTIPGILVRIIDIDRKKKIQLVMILFPGVLVVALSAARIYLVYVNDMNADGSWYYAQMLAIECAEITGTLTALSVPALVPLFDGLHGLLPTISQSLHSYSSDLRSKFKGGVSSTRSDTSLVAAETTTIITSEKNTVEVRSEHTG